MSLNVFMAIDETVTPLTGFIIDPCPDFRRCPSLVPDTSLLPDEGPDTGGVDVLSCRSDGTSSARPHLCRWLLRLLLVVVLGREAG